MPTPAPTPIPTPTPTPLPTTIPSAIQHVVVIVQENRSFDNLFYGYPGANTATSGLTSFGNVVPLAPISLAAPYDIVHADNNFLDAWDNGKMDGFNREPAGANPGTYPHPQYGYVPESERLPYIQMAQQYVVNDDSFPSQLDASFTAHQYVIAGFAGRAVNYPVGPWGCGGTVTTYTLDRKIGPSESACFTYPTIADQLDMRGISWRQYVAGLGIGGRQWAPWWAIARIVHSPELKAHMVAPQTRFFDDVAAGQLANVTWITPTLRTSDHAGSESAAGPQWVASLVNAVGESKFWPSTVIFVIWDDWGGWYDHVPPPQLDYDGLGIRVPMLCISPYAVRGVVSHTQFESASLLKFVEARWALHALAAADTRARSAHIGCLDARQKPRPFTPIATSLDRHQLETLMRAEAAQGDEDAPVLHEAAGD